MMMINRDKSSFQLRRRQFLAWK